MGFLRWVTATAITSTVSLYLPPVFSTFSVSSSSSSPPIAIPFSRFSISPKIHLFFSSLSSSFSIHHFSTTAMALSMDAPPSGRHFHPQEPGELPDVMTEYMVEMKCQGCADTAINTLSQLHGVRNVQVDLKNQIVRIFGSASVKNMSEVLGEAQMKSRLIGQGNPEDFLVSAAVAEFKGPQIKGAVRIVQVSMETARIEATFSGLLPRSSHYWSINQYGDLTRGAASTGGLFNPDCKEGDNQGERLGDLGRLNSNEEGDAFYVGTKTRLKVGDVIGRAIVIYQSEESKLDDGIAAAVIARSAGVGENRKQVCTCDGTTIWEYNPPSEVLPKM